MASLACSHAACACLLAALASVAHAGTMQPLADDELAAVRGADGLAFNLSNFSLSGPLTLSYAMPGGGASLSLSNLSLSRSDDPSATFSDPYQLKVLRRDGLADVIRLTEPQNASGLLKWQFAADWRVDANGISHDGGALVLQDLVTRGGSLTLTTPATPGVEGVAFGLALNLEIGQLRVMPRGRGDASEQLQISGLRLGAASESGTLLGTPWALADATNQPGLFNAQTDAGGSSYLHLQIGWPTTSAGAPLGGLQIDNISFKSDAGVMDLGSSRIGTMQIQFLDVKLRAGL
jgi:hypothetical protein